MTHVQSVAGLSLKERKILTYWKNSKEINRIIWRCGFFSLMMLIPIASISILLTSLFDRHAVAACFNITIGDQNKQAMFGLVGGALAYFPFSGFCIYCSMARYLKNNIDRIASMNIEPWPLDKPYTPSCLSFMNKPEAPRTYIDEFLNLDKNKQFTWPGFIKLVRIPAILILGWLVISKLINYVIGIVR